MCLMNYFWVYVSLFCSNCLVHLEPSILWCFRCFILVDCVAFYLSLASILFGQNSVCLCHFDLCSLCVCHKSRASKLSVNPVVCAFKLFAKLFWVDYDVYLKWCVPLSVFSFTIWVIKLVIRSLASIPELSFYYV